MTHPLPISQVFLRGSATYSGAAAGIYVLKTGNLATNPDLHNGEFVADVNLTAYFGDDATDAKDADQWKITGNIDDFESATNSSHDLSNWDLKLNADFGSRAVSTGNIPNDSKTWELNKATAMGGGNPGTWAAIFYGDTTSTDDENYPEAVVGEFKGHFTTGSVAGAFGAEKD